MLSKKSKNNINLIADYTGLTSAVACGFGLFIDPVLVPSSFILWTITKAVQSKLGYVNDGCLNTNYADLSISRDFFAGIGSALITSYINSPEHHGDLRYIAALPVFPLLAIASHVLRRKNLKELEGIVNPSTA